MALSDITKDAVEAAITEADALGLDVFLAKYGFAHAKRHWIVLGGARYPSKAIAGVAHKYVAGSPLQGSSAFKGGERSVVKKLRALGFEVEAAPRNPDWNRDELILALDLYFGDGKTPPGKGSQSVVDLSKLLNVMRESSGVDGNSTYRNPDGVYLKLMNFRALDPTYLAQGKVGMKSGGALEKDIWQEFSSRRVELKDAAKAIREALAILQLPQVQAIPPVPPYEGEEGGVIIGVHKRYERDPKLIREKRKAAKATGILRCEVCNFDFGATYGDLGSGYIEVHHTKPVAQMQPGSKTKLEDLALLCANCHRMAHKRRHPLTVEEIRRAMGRAD